MDVKCAICLGEQSGDHDWSITQCGHLFHTTCLLQWVRTRKTCAQCRQVTSVGDIIPLLVDLLNTYEDGSVARLLLGKAKLERKLRDTREKISRLKEPASIGSVFDQMAPPSFRGAQRRRQENANVPPSSDDSDTDEPTIPVSKKENSVYVFLVGNLGRVGREMRWTAADFWRFWASPAGQRTSGTCVTVVAIGGFLAHGFPNTLFMDKYVEILRAYEDGFPVKVKEDVEARAETLVEDLAELPRDLNVSFFTAYGFDPRTVGSIKLRFGAQIGLPQNINYAKPSDVNVADLMIRDKPFPASSEKGRRLLETLILSPEAQKFLVARELHVAKSFDVVWRASLTSGAIFLAYLWSFKFNRRLNLLAKPYQWRLVLYGFVVAFAATLRLMFGDILHYRSEVASDEYAAGLGPEFLAGGVEYYSKALERNVLLRELMGPVDGPKAYTPTGNPNVTFRSRHVPLTARKEALLKKLHDVDTREPVKGDSAASAPAPAAPVAA